MKTCPDCGELKPLTEFHWDSSMRDGRCFYCKPCKNSRTRAHAQRYKARAARAIATGTKFCPRCLQDKPLTDFGRRSSTPDGFCFCCKPCYNAKAKEYPSHPSNRDLLGSAANRVTQKPRKPINPNSFSEYHQRRKNDPEYRARRAKRNSEARTRRRARKLGGKTVPYTREQVDTKISYWGGRCWICKQVIAGLIHMDHVKPLAKGGMDCLANVRPACGSCNSRKNDRWPFTPDDLGKAQLSQ